MTHCDEELDWLVQVRCRAVRCGERRCSAMWSGEAHSHYPSPPLLRSSICYQLFPNSHTLPPSPSSPLHLRLFFSDPWCPLVLLPRPCRPRTLWLNQMQNNKLDARTDKKSRAWSGRREIDNSIRYNWSTTCCAVPCRTNICLVRLKSEVNRSLHRIIGEQCNASMVIWEET